MRKIITIGLLGAALIGCTDADIWRARSELKLKLYDAESAQFRNEKVFKVNGTTLVCGEINAKNRLGGYSGFQPFVVQDGEWVTMGDKDAETIDRTCEGAENYLSQKK